MSALDLLVQFVGSWVGYVLAFVIAYAFGYVVHANDLADQRMTNKLLLFRLRHGRYPTEAEQLRL